jgi:hypothetical protein
MGDNGMLRRLIQILLHHVNDEKVWSFGLQRDKQRGQGMRCPSAFFDDPRNAMLYARFQCCVVIKASASNRRIISQSLQSDKLTVWQSLG